MPVVHASGGEVGQNLGAAVQKCRLFRPGVMAARRPLVPCSPGSNPGGGAQSVHRGALQSVAFVSLAGALESSRLVTSASAHDYSGRGHFTPSKDG